ncbi:hypothetical protein [Maritimibacter alexandrii]|uniref:hypothetical protein n=1 Tax=Maritimibacter alexandrii TaxID=2570355 RepID=UPI001485F5B1|nr:hypothetical protein [Maritimibacter alexandrii]
MNNNSTSQSDKFKELAREIEADESERAFDEALKKMREEKKRAEKDRDDGE